MPRNLLSRSRIFAREKQILLALNFPDFSGIIIYPFSNTCTFADGINSALAS